MSKEPTYRRLRDKGRPDRAFVELSGRRIYLGEYGSEESRREYHRVLAEWAANRRQVVVEPEETTIVELAARFMRHAREYYRKPDGTATTTLHHFNAALRPLRKLYGRTLESKFGPRALKAVRQSMIKAGNCRNTINKRVSAVKQIFKWGVAEELVPPAVHQALLAVSGLRRGRSEARETDPVKPVLEVQVDAVKPFLSRQVWALIQLQLLTAARSGELVVMRSVDIDTSGKIWIYRPSDHKTQHHGHGREIYMGPEAQKILRPFMEERPLGGYLFSPVDAVRERLEVRHELRKTPLSCGNRPGSVTALKPKWKPKERYTTESFGRAIARACERAEVAHWHPHQLRHARATELRKTFGIEIARIMLGHRSAAITEVYAELDKEKALEVAGKIG